MNALLGMGIEPLPIDEDQYSFHHKGAPLLFTFGETKHRIPTASIRGDKEISTTSMSCSVHRYLSDSLGRPEHDIAALIEEAVELAADDTNDLAELTTEAHRTVKLCLDSLDLPYLVDQQGVYAITWDSEELATEVRRTNGVSDVAVMTPQIEAGGFTAQAERKVRLEDAPARFKRLLDDMAQVSREETSIWGGLRRLTEDS